MIFLNALWWDLYSLANQKDDELREKAMMNISVSLKPKENWKMIILDDSLIFVKGSE